MGSPRRQALYSKESNRAEMPAPLEKAPNWVPQALCFAKLGCFISTWMFSRQGKPRKKGRPMVANCCQCDQNMSLYVRNTQKHVCVFPQCQDVLTNSQGVAVSATVVYQTSVLCLMTSAEENMGSFISILFILMLRSHMTHDTL